MADLVYRNIMKDLKNRIQANEFASKKLPDERSLSESYGVSRSSIKRALNVLANRGSFSKNVVRERLLIRFTKRIKQFFNTKGPTWGLPTALRVMAKHPKLSCWTSKLSPQVRSFKPNYS